nr:helix-hairpin-helix domain-containing protein [Microbacterium lushaniae]
MLSEIPGLGEARIKALLRHFGSVSALREASPEQITELPGIGPKLAEAIHAHLAR